MPYIICVEVDEEGQAKERGSGLAERAYHRDELAANSALRVDVQYYLANQVLFTCVGVITLVYMVESHTSLLLES